MTSDLGLATQQGIFLSYPPYRCSKQMDSWRYFSYWTMQNYWLATLRPSWKRRMSPLQPKQKGSNMLLSHPKVVILQQILQNQVHWAGLIPLATYSVLLSSPTSPIFNQVSSNLPASQTRVPSAMLLPKPSVVLALMLLCWRGSFWCGPWLYAAIDLR